MAEGGRLTWLRRLHDQRRLWAALAVVGALVIALGSLTPGSEMPDNLPWDKANHFVGYAGLAGLIGLAGLRLPFAFQDRKSTRLNSSHVRISYAVFCLKKKKKKTKIQIR